MICPVFNWQGKYRSRRGLICYEKLLGSRMGAGNEATGDIVEGVFEADQLDRGGGYSGDEL